MSRLNYMAHSGAVLLYGLVAALYAGYCSRSWDRPAPPRTCSCGPVSCCCAICWLLWPIEATSLVRLTTGGHVEYLMLCLGNLQVASVAGACLLGLLLLGHGGGLPSTCGWLGGHGGAIECEAQGKFGCMPYFSCGKIRSEIFIWAWLPLIVSVGGSCVLFWGNWCFTCCFWCSYRSFTWWKFWA